MDVAPERRQFTETRRKHEQAGSPFFCLLFFGEAKKSKARGRQTKTKVTGSPLREDDDSLINSALNTLLITQLFLEFSCGLKTYAYTASPKIGHTHPKTSIPHSKPSASTPAAVSILCATDSSNRSAATALNLFTPPTAT